MNLKPIIKTLGALLFVTASANAGANTVYFTLTGHVTDYFGGSDFGLNVNDLVTASGSFDDSLIGGSLSGSGSLDFSSDITDLLITVGSQTFTSADDNGSGLLVIVNGALLDGLGSAGLSYAGTNPGANDLTADVGTETFLGNVEVLGVWDSYTLSAVPVPAAVWLFGSGLLGLAGIGRRKYR